MEKALWRAFDNFSIEKIGMANGALLTKKGKLLHNQALFIRVKLVFLEWLESKYDDKLEFSILKNLCSNFWSNWATSGVFNMLNPNLPLDLLSDHSRNTSLLCDIHHCFSYFLTDVTPT